MDNNKIICKLICAAQCTYSIDKHGKFSKQQPYFDHVDWNPKPFFGGPENINAALVGLSDEGIILACRGTTPPFPVTLESLADWWQDIVDTKPISENNIPGKVNEGIWHAISSVWDGIVGELAALQQANPEAPLLVTGHSKGGAMAILSAARIHFQEPSLRPPEAVYTFGGLHPGDEEFSRGYPQSLMPITRFENHLDVVPFLPPTSKLLKTLEKLPVLKEVLRFGDHYNYEHVGSLRYISRDGELIDKDSALLREKRLLQFVAELPDGIKGAEKIVRAHHITCGGTGYFSTVCPSDLCDEQD